jgi:hypothetical protein
LQVNARTDLFHTLSYIIIDYHSIIRSYKTAVHIYDVKACRDAGVYLHSFLTLTLEGSEWLVSRSYRFTPRKERRFTGSYVGPKDDLDVVTRKSLVPVGDQTTNLRPVT